jgi:hypothetical protein
MKIGRNDHCPCGSGKKYKQCCMDAATKQYAEICDDIAQTVAMSGNLSIEELNLVVQHKMQERNNRPHTDFCGLTPTQMANWLYAPFSELAGVEINTPDDLSSSPVMLYLSLILDEAIMQQGSFKATVRGNLPTKLVKKASEKLPELAVAQFETETSMSDFSGSTEEKFTALHYTRVLAVLSGILYLKSGRFYVKKAALKQYQSHGIRAFFLPMLETAVTKYNWGYLDGWDDNVDLRTLWLFMFWRLQSHSSIDKMIKEVSVAFPDLLQQVPHSEYFSPQDQLVMLIELRFVVRFLQFWGFVTVDPRRIFNRERIPRKANIQPLLTQSFTFAM